MIRFYLVPIIGSGASREDRRRPKYISGLNIAQAGMDYGKINTCLVVADVTPEQHNDLISYPDVITFPENLDDPIGDTLDQSLETIEGLKIPVDWLDSESTTRQTLHTIAAIIQIGQRLHGLSKIEAVPNGATLDTPWADLGEAAQLAAITAADSFGFDRTGLDTTNLTLRGMIHWGASQWIAPILLGGVEL